MIIWASSNRNTKTSVIVDTDDNITYLDWYIVNSYWYTVANIPKMGKEDQVEERGVLDSIFPEEITSKYRHLDFFQSRRSLSQ